MAPPSFQSSAKLERIFPGNSQMAQRMRAYNWAAHELGPPTRWPHNLRLSLGLCLTSPFPAMLWWGPDLSIFYNDAFIPFLGEAKHPKALGQPGQECWPEIWDIVGPLIEHVRTTGEGEAFEDVPLYFARRLPHEEVFLRFSHGPILAADGRTVDGIFTPCTETTQQVVGARRLETLRKLGIRASEDGSAEKACEEAAAILAENPHDVPFAAVYLAKESRDQAVLTATAGLSGLDVPLPGSVALAALDESPWPLHFVWRTHHPEEVNLQRQGFRLPGGPWPEPAEKALVLPMMAAGYHTVAGLLVVGVSTRQVLDDAYRTFFDLLASHIGTAVVDAQAHEAERRRADALAEVDRAKTVFLSNVSHEFRTPLTLILGPLEDELRGTPHHSERLQVAHRNSLRLLKLVNTLLDYSRAEAGRIDATYEPVDLAGLTAELASNFRAAIEKAGMALEVHCPPLPEPVYVDREMWEKIVLNLVSNAFKFTLAGRITVTQEARGNHVELIVKDTGSGIPAEALPRIFERFYRVKWTRARTQEGSGIGLALTQQLVKLHGGTIEVDSVLDQGSSFRVTIPLGRGHLPADRLGPPRNPAEAAAVIRPFVEEATDWLAHGAAEMPETAAKEFRDQAPQGGGQPPPRSRATIVWAEDNDDMRDYVHRLLQASYEVKAVGSGEEALHAVRRHRPDLVLADIMMPRGDGFDLLRELRADPQTRAIPVVLLSARTSEQDHIEGREAGADDYVDKPFAARELLARIASNVNLARVRRESELRVTSLVEAAMDAIICIDEDQRIVLFNRAASAMFRCPASEALGSPLERFIPERFRAAHRRHVARFAETGTTSRAMGHQLGVLWGLRADGEEFPIEASISQVELDWHRQLTVIVRDITDRLRQETALATLIQDFERRLEEQTHQVLERNEALDRAEQARQETEERYRALIHASSQVLYRMSPDWSEMWQLQGGDFIADTEKPNRDWLQQYIHPDDRERVLQAIHDSVQTGSDFELEHRVQRVDGSLGWTYSRAVPVRNTAGEIVEWFGAASDITERKQAEIALQESQRRLALALQAGEASVWEMGSGPNPRVDGTEALSAQLGYAPETMQKLSDWMAVIHDEDRPRYAQLIEELQAGSRGHFRSEWRIRARDGNWHWFMSQAMAAERNAEGQALRIVGTYANIDERKRDEQALKDNEHRLSLALEAGQATVWEIDAHTEAIRGAEHLAQFLGLDVGQLQTVSGWLSLVDENQRADLEARIEETIDGRRDGYHYEWRIQARDSSWHWFLCQGKAIERDGEGRARRVIATYTNIDERKQSERALQESERRLSLALAAADSVVWEMDAATGIVEGKDDLFHMYGYRPGDLVTLADWSTLVQDEDRPRLKALFDEIIHGQRERFHCEVRVRTRDGTWHWNLTQAVVAERDHRGQVRRLVGSHTDISQRKAAEEEIKRLNAELERRVRERTAELERSNEALLHSNLELQHFAHATAHDLKTPLRSIAGFAQLLRQSVDEGTDEQVREYSSLVIDNTRRLQALIENLLAYTRLDAQGLPLEPVDLNEVVGRVVGALATLITESEAEVRWDPLPTLAADRIQMAQVFQNLIENGIKYNRSKPPRIAIRSERLEDNWLISIADNGIGIDPRHHERIFEIFRRLHTYRQVPGSGIGLALCRRIVERHGGSIWVESTPGRGSTFYFTLPS